MHIDRATLIGLHGETERSLSDVTVRSVEPANQSLVLEVPHRSPETPATEQTRATRGEKESKGDSEEWGCSIVVTTTEGRTYSGYVEVVADSDDARFYWCGIDF
jgi:hypothetical protein